MNNVHSLSADSTSGMDIERMGSEVERVATGLVALARLMQASDPEATDGFSDTPILHGIGFLLEAASSSLQGYGLKISDDGFDARTGA